MTEKIIIYQVLPRLFGNMNDQNVPNGTLEQNGCGKMANFTPQVLQRIKNAGYTHVWYTGLLEHATKTDYTAYGIRPDHPAVVKGRAGSPYAIKDYYDIDPDLATDVPRRIKEFESLVRRTHKAGLKVIMDFVPNHVARQYFSDAKPARVHDLGADDDTTRSFSPDNNFYYILGQPLRSDFDKEKEGLHPYKEYPAKATGNDRFDANPTVNDWYETVKINYGVDYLNGRAHHFDPIPDTWKKMTAILLHWARKGVDGFRCDMAEMVPCEFWQYATAQVKNRYPGIIFIAEIYNPGAYRDYIARGGFDYLYDKVGMYDTLRAICRGEASAACITGCWQSLNDILPHMLYFLENHDEQRIASPYYANDASRAFPALVVAATMNTNPFMIYSGQEIGEPGMDAEGFSGTDGRTSIFDYWSPASGRALFQGPDAFTPRQATVYAYYHRLLSLLRTEEALREGSFFDLMYANYDRATPFNPECHFAYLRRSANQALLIVANFSDQPANAGIRIPGHAFETLNLRIGTTAAIDLLTGETQTLRLQPDAHTYVALPPCGAIILKL